MTKALNRVTMLLVFTTITGIASVIDYEVNKECPAPGHTIRWRAAYCMQSVGTDDFESLDVQKCLDKVREVKDLKDKTVCQQNVYWRKRICEAGFKGADARAKCEADEEFIPNIVKYGA